MKSHDITKLPIWAQTLIESLKRENADLEQQLFETQLASRLTCDPERSWFTITGPYKPDADPYHLWMLRDDNPHKLCSLNHKDVLLVGRYKPE